MLGKLTFAIGLGAGYVLGAKAGVQRYDAIAGGARGLLGAGPSHPAKSDAYLGGDAGVGLGTDAETGLDGAAEPDLDAGLVPAAVEQARTEEAELDRAQRDGEIEAAEAGAGPVSSPVPAELDIDAMTELELELATAPDLAPPADPPAPS